MNPPLDFFKKHAIVCAIMNDHAYDTVICGAGPAGIAAALSSVLSGAHTLLLEKLPVPGRKLLASGGGKCNFSNTLSDKDFMNSFGRNGRFMTDALRAAGRDFILKFLEEKGVNAKIVDGLYYFPESESAADIRSAFLRTAQSKGLELQTDTPVRGLIMENGRIAGVRTPYGNVECRKFILAAGGTAMSTLGGSGDGLRLAESAGHSIVPPLPAMAPVYTADSWIPVLSGVSLPDAELFFTAGKASGRIHGEILFTHDGLSGPAALSLSGPMYRAWEQNPGKFTLHLNFLAGRNMPYWIDTIDSFRKKESDRLLRSSLGALLPRSLASALTAMAGLSETKNQTLKNADRDNMAKILTDTILTVRSLCPMEKAMAMSGGVSLKEVDPRTMQSKLVQGLYFAGEVLDLTGPCGGFNIQFALSSGYLAGMK